MTSRAEDRIDVAPLAEAFVNSGMTLADVCRQLGWMRPTQRYGPGPDVSRLKRALGMAPWHTNAAKRRSGLRRTYINSRIGYDQAVKIARALNVDPVDLGL